MAKLLLVVLSTLALAVICVADVGAQRINLKSEAGDAITVINLARDLLHRRRLFADGANVTVSPKPTKVTRSKKPVSTKVTRSAKVVPRSVVLETPVPLDLLTPLPESNPTPSPEASSTIDAGTALPAPSPTFSPTVDANYAGQITRVSLDQVGTENGTELVFTWAEPEYTGPPIGPLSYDVEQANTTGAPTAPKFVSIATDLNVTTYTFASPDECVTTWSRVAAVTAVDLRSVWSAPVGFVSASPVGNVTVSNITDTSAVISWSAPAPPAECGTADSYKLWVSDGPSTKADTNTGITTTAVLLTGLGSETRYCVAVSFVSSYGADSPKSPLQCFFTAVRPTTPKSGAGSRSPSVAGMAVAVLVSAVAWLRFLV